MFPGTFARTTPDKPAAVIAASGERLTYRELEENSARLARYLHGRGLRRGDTLALLSDNQLTAFEVYWAAMRSGLYLTAVNHNLAPGEVAYIVNDSSAKALIVAYSQRDLAEAIAGQIPAVSIRLAFGGPVDGTVDGFGSYAGALAATSAEPLPDQPRGSDMLYSSGTTGRPKGIKAPLPDRQVHEPGDPYVQLFVPYFGFSAGTIYLSPAPIYHAAPLRFCATIQSVGGTVVMMERFGAEAALAAIERFRVTHLQFVPTMFVRMLKLEDEVRARYDISSVQVAIHAAAPCPPDVKRAMIDWWGPRLTEYYASTEGNGLTLVTSDNWLSKPGTVGTPVLGILHICNEAGDELGPGEVGLIYWEREPPHFEYHNDPVQTAAARHPATGDWSTVGDLGYADEDGYLFLTDRASFMIISGGVNIYPQEIENALALHPKVLDVAVIGVPDPDMGQQVKGFVQLADGVPGGQAVADELAGFLRTRIARFKVPRRFSFVASLPRTATGKLAKHRLTEISPNGPGWEPEFTVRSSGAGGSVGALRGDAVPDN
jgi:acyl-CoA synthetase (AMP-forming)/AMP-acid ligase II